MIAERIQPDVAIVTDVTHDTFTPMIDKIVSGEVKSERSFNDCRTSCHNKLLKLIQDTAKSMKLLFKKQLRVLPELILMPSLF
ncbi:MAG: hypothetical protein R3B93_08085 [Bacteroidia bacterium]